MSADGLCGRWMWWWHFCIPSSTRTSSWSQHQDMIRGTPRLGSHGLQASAQPPRTSAVTCALVRHYRRSTGGDRVQAHTIGPLRVQARQRSHPRHPDALCRRHSDHRKDPTLVEQEKKELKERFEMTDMGEANRILGMEATRDYDEGTPAITQTAYVDNILERFGM